MGGPVDFNSGSAGAGADHGVGGSTGGKGSAGTGTTSGTGGALGGTGGALVGAAGAMDGEAGEAATGPYAPRSGPFKALVYSETAGYRHDSIEAGQQMFTDLATELDFEVTLSEDFSFTAENLAAYELVVFLNTTGNILDAEEKVAFEQWMTSRNGAFVGTHSATDTENGWLFYSEVTGQYFDGHVSGVPPLAQIDWEPDALGFPAVRGLPSPWERAEEWYYFNKVQIWSTKPGFKILGNVEVNGRTQPVSFVREYGNFRSFYTSLGHAGSTFEDPLVRHHIAGGLFWAVRREHLVE
jgi:type 1 glutamine amidotransferase